MKTFFIKHIFGLQTNTDVEILCWIKNKRDHGGIIFFELEDSTGSIDSIVLKDSVSNNEYVQISKITIDSSVKVHGVTKNNTTKKGKQEIQIISMLIIGTASPKLEPSPRSLVNPFEKRYSKLILNKRHLYIRNSKIRSVFVIKYQMLSILREWFKKYQFIEVDTPILTQTNIYDNNNTFNTDYFGTKVYLSQCAGLYLGAMVPTFEQVYTITPAFRRESSKSPRHNPEFYHLKCQAAFCSLEDMMNFIENMLFFLVNNLNTVSQVDLNNLNISINVQEFKPPYPKISYLSALKILKSEGIDIEIGQSLNEKAETIITSKYNKPVFVTNMPAKVEPFLYKIMESDNRFTKTADLLLPGGYGEILGVAEFIQDSSQLLTRINEKKYITEIEKQKIQWYVELCNFGNIPRSGFGMGVERLLRALLKLPHIRDAFLFPRLYDHLPYP
ncbi:MAG TPA: asparagine--tRNA ligase [Candidatus Woesebacteria bacterium]|nr:asparagine--tRNA ligase [Candidatus Woesebacteria bacterium]